jgi:hypothetical protein
VLTWENFQKQMKDCPVSGFVLNARQGIREEWRNAGNAGPRTSGQRGKTSVPRSKIKKALACYFSLLFMQTSLNR